ncbi:glycosyl transferase family 9 [Sideroxydans lithotrophicus ES-1]|uniref:Glycosyl transferase family 9 n=2 Tax=Sideroxydans TaxID=314343 RepID=D5CQA9_SIDLE|nr:glycosyl transferase family 9 [Sideroxydans lithotrophicus ES-1]
MVHLSTRLPLVNDHSQANLRIAIVRFSALGDVVMVSAAVLALQLSFPAATITWITSPFAYALLKGMDGVNFEVFDKPRTFADYRAFYRAFRHRQFDVVLAMQANLRINLLYPALHAPVKIGFDRTRAREGQWLFCNRQIPFSDSHLTDSFLSFVETLSGSPAMATWKLPLDASDEGWAREQFQSLPKPWVAIHPHSSKAERNWLPERYEEIVTQAISRWKSGVVLTGGNSATEMALCERLSHLFPDHTLNLCGKSSPKQLAAVLGLADVLIAPDTGAVHIARAMGTPVVGLYAVASPKLTGPYRQLEYCVDRYPQAVKKYLGKDADEVPWNTRVHHPDAMALIEVSDVIFQLEKLLGPLI